MGNAEIEQQDPKKSFSNKDLIEQMMHGKEVIERNERNEADQNQSFISMSSTNSYGISYVAQMIEEATKTSEANPTGEKPKEEEILIENEGNSLEINEDEDAESEAGNPMISTPGGGGVFPEDFPKKEDKERNVRMDYMKKLLKTNTWTPTEEKKYYEKIIILDWDELFDCIPYLMKNNLHKNNFQMDLKQSELFAKVEFQILIMITKATQAARTRIITNKTKKWINFSLGKFYPNIHKMIKTNKDLQWYYIPEEIEKKYGNDMNAKLNILVNWSKSPEVQRSTIWNINYFGNISYENSLFKDKPNLIIKNVKVIGCDDFNLLPKELILLNAEFDKIISKPKKMNMKIDKKNFK